MQLIIVKKSYVPCTCTNMNANNTLAQSYKPLTEGAGWSENKPSIYLEYLDMIFRSYKLLFSKGKI